MISISFQQVYILSLHHKGSPFYPLHIFFFSFYDKTHTTMRGRYLMATCWKILLFRVSSLSVGRKGNDRTIQVFYPLLNIYFPFLNPLGLFCVNSFPPYFIFEWWEEESFSHEIFFFFLWRHPPSSSSGCRWCIESLKLKKRKMYTC